MDKQAYFENYGKLVVRTWTEPEFLARLKTDSIAVLIEAGLPVRSDANVRVVVMEPTGKGTPEDQFESWIRGDQTGTYDLFIPYSPGDGFGAGTAEWNACCCCTPCCCCG